MAKTVKISIDGHEFTRVLDDDKAMSALREFDKTVKDLADGGDGSAPNGIPAKSNKKFTFEIWQDLDDGLWSTIAKKGKFFIKSVLSK